MNMKYGNTILATLFAYAPLAVANDDVCLTVVENPPDWELEAQGHPNRVYFLQGSSDLLNWDYLLDIFSPDNSPVQFGCSPSSDHYFARVHYIDDVTDPDDVDGDGLSNDFEIEHYPVLDPFDSSDQPVFVGTPPSDLEDWVLDQLEDGESPFDEAPFPKTTPLPQVRFDCDGDQVFTEENHTFANPSALPVTLNLGALVRGTFSENAGHVPSYQQTWEIAISPPDVEVGTSNVPSTLAITPPSTEPSASLSQTSGAFTEITFRTYGMYVIRHNVVEQEADFDDRVNEEHFVVWVREDFEAPAFWQLANAGQSNASTSELPIDYLNDRLSNWGADVAKPGLNRIFELPPASKREVALTHSDFGATAAQRFENAITFAETWEGTKINVPAGNYSLSSSLQIQGNGTSLVGAADSSGNPVSILSFSAVGDVPRDNTAVFVGRRIFDDPNSIDPQTKNIILKNLLLQQSGSTNIERMLVIGDRRGDNGAVEIAERIWCDNVDTTDYTRSGVLIEHSQGVLLSNCKTFEAVPANSNPTSAGENVFATGGFGGGFVIQDWSSDWSLRREENNLEPDRRDGIRANNNWIWNCSVDFIRHGLLLQFGPHHNLIERTTIERYHEDAFDLHGRGEYANELRWNVAKNSVANGRNSGAQNADLDADGFGIGNTNHGCSGPFNWIHHNDIHNSFGGIRVSGEFESASNQSDARDGQIFTGSHYQLVEQNTVDGCRFGLRCEQLAGQFLSVRNNTFRDSDGNSVADLSPVTASPETLRFEFFRAIDIDESFATAANSQILGNNCIAWTDGQLMGSGFPRNAQEAISILPSNGGGGIDTLATQAGNTISGFPTLPSDDTYVRSALPVTSFGTETQLRVAGSNNTHIVFLKFDLSEFSDGGTVSAARLTLFSSAAENPAVMHNLYLIADDPNISSDDQTWSEDSLTWDNSDTLQNQGQLGVSLMSTLTAHLEPVNFNIDLGNQVVRDEVEKALGGMLTLRLEADPEFVNYISSETGSSNLECRPTFHLEIAP